MIYLPGGAAFGGLLYQFVRLGRWLNWLICPPLSKDPQSRQNG